MEKDWLFSTDEYICDLRTVAVLVMGGFLLRTLPLSDM